MLQRKIAFLGLWYSIIFPPSKEGVQGLDAPPSEPCPLPISAFLFQASVAPVWGEAIPHINISGYKTGIWRITINAQGISGTLISAGSPPTLISKDFPY